MYTAPNLAHSFRTAITLFSSRVWTRLLIVSILSSVSFGLLLATLSWTILEETGSIILTSCVMAGMMIAQVPAGLITGSLVHRLGAKRVISWGLFLFSGILFLLALILALNSLDLGLAWLVILLNAIGCLLIGITGTANRSFGSLIVPEHLAPSSVVVFDIGVSFSFAMSPFVVGVGLNLLPAWLLLAVTAFVAISATVTWVVSGSGNPIGDIKYAGKTEFAAKSLIYRLFENKLIYKVLLLGLCVEITGFSYIAIIPVFIKEVLGGGPVEFGILVGLIGTGEFLGMAAMAVLILRVVRTGRIFMISVLLSLLACLSLFLSSSLILAYFLGSVVGILGAIFWAVQTSLLVETSGSNSRTQVLGLQQVTWGLGASGSLIVGLLATLVSVVTAVVILVAIGLSLLFVITVGWPDLRRHTVARKVAESGT